MMDVSLHLLLPFPNYRKFIFLFRFFVPFTVFLAAAVIDSCQWNRSSIFAISLPVSSAITSCDRSSGSGFPKIRNTMLLLELYHFCWGSNHLPIEKAFLCKLELVESSPSWLVVYLILIGSPPPSIRVSLQINIYYFTHRSDTRSSLWMRIILFVPPRLCISKCVRQPNGTGPHLDPVFHMRSPPWPYLLAGPARAVPRKRPINNNYMIPVTEKPSPDLRLHIRVLIKSSSCNLNLRDNFQLLERPRVIKTT